MKMQTIFACKCDFGISKSAFEESSPCAKTVIDLAKKMESLPDNDTRQLDYYRCGIELFDILIENKLIAIDALIDRERALFRWACIAGFIDVAEWLIGAANFGDDIVRKEGHNYLAIVLYHGHMVMAQWLSQRFNLTGNYGNVIPDLCMLCICGRLDGAKWIVSTFNITRDRVCANNNMIFYYTCCHGHLLVAQWLAVTFDINCTDARSRNNSALRGACYGGHIGVAQWLVGAFCLTAEDFFNMDNAPLSELSARGHLKLLKWSLMAFTKDPVEKKNELIVAHSIAEQNGYYDVAAWISMILEPTEQYLRLTEEKSTY